MQHSDSRNSSRTGTNAFCNVANHHATKRQIEMEKLEQTPTSQPAQAFTEFFLDAVSKTGPKTAKSAPP